MKKPKDECSNVFSCVVYSASFLAAHLLKSQAKVSIIYHNLIS